MIMKANLTLKVFTQLYKSTHLAPIICVLCFFLCSPKAYSARLIDCKTGDTCIIKDKNTEEFQVKIIGIDSPAIDQPYGYQSKKYLISLLKGKDFDFKCEEFSGEMRNCSLNHRGEDIAELMVKNGAAWDYPKFSGGKYKADQEEAQAKKIGLWSFVTGIGSGRQAEIKSPYCWKWPINPQCESNIQYEPSY